MKGILAIYINFNPEQHGAASTEVVMELFKKVNRDLLDKIKSDLGLHAMYIPAMNESCRIERVWFNKSNNTPNNDEENE